MIDASLIEILHRSREMRSEEEVNNFIDGINKLKALPQQKDDLIGLFLTFSDTTEHKEVMWSVIHLAEKYESQMYISTLLSVTPSLMATAMGWLKSLYIRILNHPETLEELILALRQAPEINRTTVEGFFLELLNRLESDMDEESRQIVEKLKEKVAGILNIINAG